MITLISGRCASCSKTSTMEALCNFCSGTSLHGWPHLPDSGRSNKVFWFLTIIGSIVAAVYFGNKTINQFLSSNVATNLETSTAPLGDAEFPKIVVCNSYKIRQSFLDTIVDPSSNESEITRFYINKEYITGYGFFNHTKVSGGNYLTLFININNLKLKYSNINTAIWLVRFSNICNLQIYLFFCKNFSVCIIFSYVQPLKLPDVVKRKLAVF